MMKSSSITSWWRVGRSLLLFAATLVYVGSMLTTIVWADDNCNGMSQVDCSAVYGNWENWIPDPGECSADASAVTLTGSDNMAKAMNFFTGQGLTAPQAAGIIGNLMIESHMDPSIIQNGGHGTTPTANVGFGIAQWTTASRQQGLVALANKENVAPNTLGVQLQYLWQELHTGYATALAKLRQTSTASEAAVSFMIYYEAPKDHDPNGANALARSAEANGVLKLYGAGSQPGTGGDPVTSDSGDGSGCSGTSADLGTGTGKFTTDSSKTYPGVQQMISRAQAVTKRGSSVFQQICGSSCYQKCDHLAGGVWGYSSSGYATANEHWKAMKSSGHGHPGDRNPPVGALLFYDTGEAAGHVAVYLGNNKILSNDVNGNGGAYITDASSMESGPWRLSYLGWSDPVFGGAKY